MIHQNKRRGSVLLMVVGLLTIVAMLGSTFIFISYLDARQTQAVAERNHVDPLARGVLSEVRMLLKNDLYVDANGPYGGVDPAPHGWVQYLDYADEPLLEIPSSADVRTDGPAGGPTLPTANLRATGITNSKGDEYYVAYTVTDLSSLICLNTAGGDITTTTPRYPTQIDMLALKIGDPPTSVIEIADFQRLAEWRCGGTEPSGPETPPDPLDFETYYTKAASKLMAAEYPYLPFPIGEELYLRHYSAPEAGRLAEWFDLSENMDDANRHLFTTVSQSSHRLRRVIPHIDNKISLELGALDDIEVRESLYTELLEITNQPDSAGHFVANLWATLSDSDQQRAFLFTAPDTGIEYYGAIEQLVISEVYAYSLCDSGVFTEPVTTAGDSGKAFAIELYNPFDDPITDVGNYILECDGNIYEFDPLITVPAHDRIVFYAISGNAVKEDGDVSDPDDRETATEDHFGFSPSWHKAQQLIDFDSKSVELKRKAKDPNGPEKYILLDRVSPADFNFTQPDQATPIVIRQAMRDDFQHRGRAMVAKLVVNSTITNPGSGHTLGGENDLQSGDIAELEQVPMGIDLTINRSAIDHVGFVNDILLVGPRQGKSLPEALADVTDGLAGDKVARGRACPLTTPIVGGKYPDVPFGALLGELFHALPNTEPIYGRVYGRININTASEDVLQCLFPESLTLSWGTLAIDRKLGAAFILAYRNRSFVDMDDDNLDDGIIDYTPSRATVTGIADLRTDSATQEANCFLTPGEVAIPLADYIKYEITQQYSMTIADAEEYADYLAARDSLYRHMSNMITVNSDVFAVNIVVRLGNNNPNSDEDRWDYVAVIDRGNVSDPDHLPAVLMFTEVK